ncbi:unnamed protein product [Darwinula stevensoni]|uniref:ABC transporter domain-containing protein n=1 Tax=Darwinula stevensoni TaxID=69355 RepID=A0A7R9AI49_9CRUS|nr:unnamed protein product [Darwinula stevensoni]CAG0906051.1 unnamed protein product [Darwinula stevensoni]
MTALENVMVGRHVRTGSGLVGAILRTSGFKAEEKAIAKRAQELLDYVGIGQYAPYKARTLSYGDQRRLEIARALATDPQLIALDEPAAGMNATEKVQLRELIDRIRKDNRTILLIEHDVKLVMGLCDRVTVLDYGKQIAEGKTTTMKAITGGLNIQGGEILYKGKSIKKQGAWDLVKQGLAMVPEGRGIFTRMTILENLRMGAYIRNDHAGIQSDIEKVFATFPRLQERKDQLAGTLSGGEQQMLAMGRALMSRPSLLLLDEPSMGLSPIMVDKIFEVVKEVYNQGVTVVLVEQNASRALSVADRGYVMDSGKITLTGIAKDMLQDPKVRAAYLGE